MSGGEDYLATALDPFIVTSGSGTSGQRQPIKVSNKRAFERYVQCQKLLNG